MTFKPINPQIDTTGITRRDLLAKSFSALTILGLGSKLSGCGSPTDAQISPDTFKPFSAEPISRFNWHSPMGVLQDSSGKLYGVNAPTMGKVSPGDNNIFPLNHSNPNEAAAKFATNLQAGGMGTPTINQDIYINAALKSGTTFVLLTNLGLSFINENFTAQGYVPWANNHNIAGGLVLAGGNLYTATSIYDQGSPRQGIIQKYEPKSDGSPSLNPSDQIDLKHKGDNPTSMAVRDGRLYVLMSGNTDRPYPLLAKLDKNILSLTQSLIILPGNRVAQTSNVLAIDDKDEFAFIGTSDDSGEVWKVDLRSGEYQIKSLNPNIGFHASVIYHSGYVFVSAHKEGALYILDPESLDVLQKLLFDEQLGPAVVQPGIGLIQLARGAAYLVKG